MDERRNSREFIRVQVKLEAELRTGSKVLIKGHLGDISMNGFYLMCTGTLPMNSICQIMLVLDGGQGVSCVQAQGTVTRIDECGLAIQFTEIFGEESAGHLRNLVLLNSHEQVKQVEQEFREHVGLKPNE